MHGKPIMCCKTNENKSNWIIPWTKDALLRIQHTHIHTTSQAGTRNRGSEHTHTHQIYFLKYIKYIKLLFIIIYFHRDHVKILCLSIRIKNCQAMFVMLSVRTTSVCERHAKTTAKETLTTLDNLLINNKNSIEKIFTKSVSFDKNINQTNLILTKPNNLKEPPIQQVNKCILFPSQIHSIALLMHNYFLCCNCRIFHSRCASRTLCVPRRRRSYYLK